MIAERASCPSLEQQKSPGRQLRTRILLANAFAWIVVIVLIRALVS